SARRATSVTPTTTATRCGTPRAGALGAKSATSYLSRGSNNGSPATIGSGALSLPEATRRICYSRAMEYKKAHFIGIAGKGMSAVALLMREAGVEITGSDEGFYPPVSDYLAAANIPFSNGYKKENIPDDADVIVIGKNAKLTKESNEEVA